MTHRSRSGGPVKQRVQKALRKAPPPPPPPPGTPVLIPGDRTILDLLHTALRPHITSPTFRDSIQRIKGLLFDREWLAVFTDPELLGAYAGRWVPSRALCYRDLLVSLPIILQTLTSTLPPRHPHSSNNSDISEEDEDEEENVGEEGQAVAGSSRQVLSLGGGAGSELIALAALLHSAPSSSTSGISWAGIDIGLWAPIIDTFTTSLRTEWSLPLPTSFIQSNILEPGYSLPPLESTILSTLSTCRSKTKPA